MLHVGKLNLSILPVIKKEVHVAVVDLGVSQVSHVPPTLVHCTIHPQKKATKASILVSMHK